MSVIRKQALIHKLSPDDWGFSPSINEASLEIAREKLAHTISVSVKRKYAGEEVGDLLALQKSGLTRVALHLDFSYPGCPLGWRDILFGGDLLQREIREQMESFARLGLGLDSINGHRHVHLYPAVLRQLGSEKVPLRQPADNAHLFSYAGGFAAGVGQRASWERAGYLRAQDCGSAERFFAKMSRFAQVICHPAKFDDFTESGMDDPLRAERIFEFEKIKKYGFPPQSSTPV